MAHVTLFHSVCGLRPAVLADAERLRAAGHEVATPDLFGGAVFDDVDSGMAFRKTLDSASLDARIAAAVEATGPGHVFGGYSFGAAIAQDVVETRPESGGGLFIAHAAGPWSVPRWPDVPTQAHVARDDEWVDDVEGAQAAGIEVFQYDGGHLFTDPDLPDYDAASAAQVWERVLSFLDRLG